MPHIHELIDFTASAFIVHEDKILLIHHKKLDTWLQIGGHIELDEDPDEAMMREIEEECGLKVEFIGEMAPCSNSETTKSLMRPHFINIHKINDTHRHCDLGYVFRAITTEPQLEEDGAHDIGWFTYEELCEMNTFENMRELAKASLEIAAKAR